MNIYNKLKFSSDVIGLIYRQMNEFQYINQKPPTIINMSIDVYNFLDVQFITTQNWKKIKPIKLFGVRINIVPGVDKFISFGYDNFIDNYDLLGG